MIPLTSLTESSQVKKAYQKARLCLHPDKLQQRGATLSQKYVAEKAFSILQVNFLVKSLCYFFFAFLLQHEKVCRNPERVFFPNKFSEETEVTHCNYNLYPSFNTMLYDCRMHGLHSSPKISSSTSRQCREAWNLSGKLGTNKESLDSKN